MAPLTSGTFGLNRSASAPVSVSLRSTPTSIAHASPTWKVCVSPTFANTRGPYSPNSRFTLD